MDYSKEELRDFEKEMEVYKIIKNIEGKDCPLYDETKFYKENGGLNQDGSIILDGYSSEDGKVTYKRPIKFIELRNKLAQLYKLQGRREYAIKMSKPN